MQSSSSALEARLRKFFKVFNHFMVWMWRLGLGSWVNALPDTGGLIMVITHMGRKSGLPRRTPVNFTVVDGDVYCTAGFGPVSDWYRNILVQPKVEVWLPDGWWSGHAEDVSDSPERVSLLRKVLIASGFAARAAGINPHTMTDEELAHLTRSYRLVRIHLQTACTGPGGPGDLAWVWPLATMILLPLVFFKRKKA
jgi:deazaflavin-dependent oxidoreductase (nitroreductase family)